MTVFTWWWAGVGGACVEIKLRAGASARAGSALCRILRNPSGASIYYPCPPSRKPKHPFAGPDPHPDFPIPRSGQGFYPPPPPRISDRRLLYEFLGFQFLAALPNWAEGLDRRGLPDWFPSGRIGYLFRRRSFPNWFPLPIERIKVGKFPRKFLELHIFEDETTQ